MQIQKVKDKDVAEFEIGDLSGIVITLVVVGIITTYGVQIMADVRGDIPAGECTELYTYNETAGNCYLTTNSSITTSASTNVAYTAAGDGVTALAKISDKLGLIVTIILAALIIGILMRYLWIK